MMARELVLTTLRIGRVLTNLRSETAMGWVGAMVGPGCACLPLRSTSGTRGRLRGPPGRLRPLPRHPLIWHPASRTPFFSRLHSEAQALVLASHWLLVSESVSESVSEMASAAKSLWAWASLTEWALLKESFCCKSRHRERWTSRRSCSSLTPPRSQWGTGRPWCR
jgi:hypothetical protein